MEGLDAFLEVEDDGFDTFELRHELVERDVEDALALLVLALELRPPEACDVGADVDVAPRLRLFVALREREELAQQTVR